MSTNDSVLVSTNDDLAATLAEIKAGLSGGGIGAAVYPNIDASGFTVTAAGVLTVLDIVGAGVVDSFVVSPWLAGSLSVPNMKMRVTRDGVLVMDKFSSSGVGALFNSKGSIELMRDYEYNSSLKIEVQIFYAFSDNFIRGTIVRRS